jgi:hypothetical protein
MQVKVNTLNFEKEINNIINYSFGFLEGAQSGKKTFLNNLGKDVIKVLGTYVDVNAKMDHMSLHHVYEWYKTGSPEARLFDLNYSVTNNGLSINSTFRQSRTVSHDSTVPFYNKARIMESGVPITIKPKASGVLAFDADGQTVFTKKQITIENPGGTQAQGSFENIIDEFISKYFKQSFLKASGLYDYLSKPTVYKKNIKEGMRVGKSAGVSTGIAWIINAKVSVE